MDIGLQMWKREQHTSGRISSIATASSWELGLPELCELFC